MKIHTALCFKPEDLSRYLTSVGLEDFGKKEYEILIAFCFRKMLEIQKGYKDYSICFPSKETLSKELDSLIGTSKPISSLGEILDTFVNEDTLIDVIYLNPIEAEKPKIYPVQIKRFGHGAQAQGGTDGLITFLDSMKRFPQNENSLVISLEGSFTNVHLPTITKWINENGIPFREVVVLTKDAAQGVTYCQLKPNNGKHVCSHLTKDEILRFG